MRHALFVALATLLLWAFPALGQEVEQAPSPPGPPAAESPPPSPPTPVISREGLFCSPFIADEDRPARVGSVLTPLVRKEQLSLEDRVFLGFQGTERPAPGDRYTIVRDDKLIVHPRTRAPLGRRIRVLGLVEVTSLEGTLAQGRVILSCEPISPGDAVIAYRIPEPPSLPAVPTDLKMDGSIVEASGDQEILGIGQVAFIDLGAARGIVPGDVFSILQGIDRVLSPETGEVIQLPPALAGELVVLKTSARSATVLITQSAREIHIGDRISLRRKVP